MGPADWADAHVWCPYLFDVHILVVISNTLTTWSKTNETIHVYRCFAMPGFYTIAYFVSGALNFSLFDHDAFVCEFRVIKPSAFTSTYQKKKLSFLKLAPSYAKFSTIDLKVIAVLSHLLKHLSTSFSLDISKNKKTKANRKTENPKYVTFFRFLKETAANILWGIKSYVL